MKRECGRYSSSKAMQKSMMYPIRSMLQIVPNPMSLRPQISSGMNSRTFVTAIKCPKAIPERCDNDAFINEQVSVPYPTFSRNDNEIPMTVTPISIIRHLFPRACCSISIDISMEWNDNHGKSISMKLKEKPLQRSNGSIEIIGDSLSQLLHEYFHLTLLQTAFLSFKQCLHSFLFLS